LPAGGKTQSFPRFIGIGGGPASGKSFLAEMLQANRSLPADAVIHDPDLVMQAIPQYVAESKIDPISAFKKWELPARYLSHIILLEALKAGYNIIYIRTFALPDSLRLVNIAKKNGI